MSDPRNLFAQNLDSERVPFLSQVAERWRAALATTEGGEIDEAIRELSSDRPIDLVLARTVMERITDGAEDEVSIGAFLVCTAPERMAPDAIATFAHVMRMRAQRIAPKVGPPLADTCGTGGDAFKTLNVSTAAAFVLVAHGIAVAKHGNRGITSACGSADVLEALGVQIDVEPDRVRQMIELAGIGFLFAPRFHPAMRHVQPVRRRLAAEGALVGRVLKTIFNVLGPLTNPAGATHQLVGVYAPELVIPVARALGSLRIERALVVHGRGPAGEAMDEVSPFGPTLAALVERDGSVTEITIDPQTLGIHAVEPARVAAAATAAENAARVAAVLGGEDDHARELVALNAGAALWVAERAADLPSGIAAARDELRSGRGLRCLERLVDLQSRVAA